MAAYTGGPRGCYGKTLVASTVDTVTFTQNFDEIEVVISGGSPVYVTVDGSTPTVANPADWEVPVALLVRKIPCDLNQVDSNTGGTVVLLISAGTPTYSITGYARSAQ
jgi:hypothetical protein